MRAPSRANGKKMDDVGPLRGSTPRHRPTDPVPVGLAPVAADLQASVKLRRNLLARELGVLTRLAGFAETTGLHETFNGLGRSLPGDLPAFVHRRDMFERHHV